MTAYIIDGRALALKIRLKVKERVEAFREKYGMAPGLAVVLVGDDPASAIYVRNKSRASDEVGIKSTVIRLPSDSTTDDVVSVVDELALDAGIHGILVQLPMPRGIDESLVLSHIPKKKDVDGITAQSIGSLALGLPGFLPCTPKGVIELIKSANVDISGKNAVVVGRSNIVGKPLALLLTRENATVTLCHSMTQNLSDITKNADILISAVGRAGFITGDMIKEGACVIDVGINRVDGKLYGDVVFDEAFRVAGAITPVPGGVGPMTIAELMDNTYLAAENSLL